METFSALLAICAGNSPVTGEFPAQRPVTRSFDDFFALNGWINNREAGDLRRHRAHYDATVMRWYNVLNKDTGKKYPDAVDVKIRNVDLISKPASSANSDFQSSKCPLCVDILEGVDVEYEWI